MLSLTRFLTENVLGPLSTPIFIRNKSRPMSGAKSSLRNTAKIRVEIVVSLACLVVGCQPCGSVTKAGFASGGSSLCGKVLGTWD